MKNLFTLLVFLFVIQGATNAQNYYWPNIYTAETTREHIKYKQRERDSILKNKITEVTNYNRFYDDKGRLTRTFVDYEAKYNQNGDLVSENIYGNKGKLRQSFVYGYEPNGLQSSFKKYNRKGKFERGWKYTFNSMGLVDSMIHFWKKEGKVSWGQSYIYNADSNVIKIINFDDNKKIYVTIERDYYPHKQLKETRTYNKKGKLKSVIKYDCTPIGTLANGRRSDTTSQCKKTEYDADNNKIVTTEITNKKGKTWRYISKYNKEDKMLEYSSIDHKGRMQVKYTYTYNAQGWLAHSVYTFYKKPKRGFSYSYEYNANGQQTLIKGYDYKNELMYDIVKLMR